MPAQYLSRCRRRRQRRRARLPLDVVEFLQPQPDDRFPDRKFVADNLSACYLKVEPPYRYGDLLFFFNRGKPWLAIHSAVYLADDVVFTKNGQVATAPWMLMTRADLKGRYSYADPLVVQGYRRR